MSLKVFQKAKFFRVLEDVIGSFFIIPLKHKLVCLKLVWKLLNTSVAISVLYRKIQYRCQSCPS